MNISFFNSFHNWIHLSITFLVYYLLVYNHSSITHSQNWTFKIFFVVKMKVAIKYIKLKFCLILDQWSNWETKITIWKSFCKRSFTKKKKIITRKKVTSWNLLQFSLLTHFFFYVYLDIFRNIRYVHLSV